MKTITDIQPQKNNPNRCNVYLDGQYFCRMELLTVVTNHLKAGMRIAEPELDRIILDSEYDIALGLSFRYLERGMKTKKQLITYLKRKGFLDSVICKVINRLAEYGYADDEAYAKAYLSVNKAKKGTKMLSFMLKYKGIDKDIVERVMDGVEDDEDGALIIAKKYLRGKEMIYENIVKCYRHLVSKGFSYDTAKTVVYRLKDENEISED